MTDVTPEPMIEVTIVDETAQVAPIVYVHPLELTEELLQQVIAAARRPMEDVCKGLAAGAYHCFRVGSLLCVVCVDEDRRLQVLAIIQEGRAGNYFFDLAARLKELGRAWGCVKVETTGYTPEVIGILQAVGATVESVTVVLEI